MAVQNERTAAARASEDADHVGAVVVVEHVLQAAGGERLVGGQMLVWEDQVVLPVRRILRHGRERLEHRRHVRLGQRHFGADPP